MKLEMSELRARQRLELERVKRDKERELEEVHERVKQALERKEGNLKTLRSQHEVTTTSSMITVTQLPIFYMCSPHVGSTKKS